MSNRPEHAVLVETLTKRHGNRKPNLEVVFLKLIGEALREGLARGRPARHE